MAVYLVTYSPRFHSSDGMAMFSMAESLARRGDSDIDQIQWMGLQQGTYSADGHLYSRKGPGMSLLLLPLVWMGLLVPLWGPVTTALLFNSLATAATAVGIFLILRRLGYGDRLGIAASLIFGLGTLAWPYAKTCFSDPLAGLCLIAGLLFLMRSAARKSLVDAAIAGVAMAVSVATRYANIVLVAPFVLYLLWSVRGRLQDGKWSRPTLQTLIGWRSGLWRPLVAFASPLLLTGLLLIWYNVVRYGDPFNTGYLPQESFSGIWWQGILGLLVSPGRGLFLYAPVLLIALPAIPAAIRRYPPEAALSLSIVIIHLLLYGKWFMWHGGYAWGPRFIVPAIPFLTLLLPPALTWLRASVWRFAAGALMALSIGLQIVGLSVHFELYQNQLLTTGLPLFAPETFFQPRYSPLLGQLHVLTQSNLDFGWVYEGRLQWPLLIGLLAGMFLTGSSLSYHYVNHHRPAVGKVILLTGLAVAASTGWLLTNVHQQYPHDLQAAVDALNTRSSITDAIVTGSPADSIPFAELYRGQADVVGLSAGTLGQDVAAVQSLQRIVDGYAKVWWLPGWVSTVPSDVQNQLSQDAFVAASLFFPTQPGSSQGRSLTLYYFPEEPMDSRTLDVFFSDHIHLLRADIGITKPQASHILPVILYWEAAVPLSNDYTVFVQLQDAAGNRITGSDARPALGTQPTTTWAPGQVVTDHHALLLPDDLPTGPYTLVTGLYLANSGQRLVTGAGQDSVQIASYPATP